MMATGTLAGVSVTGTAAGSIQDGDDGEDGDGPQPGEEGYLEEQFPGLEVLSVDPENAQAAARETYTSYITPREEHYIRNHYLSPQIEEDDHEIELRFGEETVTLTMAEVKRDYSTTSVAHTMQCSGNGRAYFQGDIGGNQFSFGAVGNTIWTGTRLSEILTAYGVDESDGDWLLVAGADAPGETEPIFARSIPMEKVMADCILAYEMNGAPMAAEHGFPVRLVVPGWMGNNSVKWVGEMEVMDTMVFGEEWERYLNWQQFAYRILAPGQEADQNRSIDVFDTWDAMDARAAGEIDWNPYIYDQVVKSIIGHPGEGATVTPREQDGQIEVLGVAWAGDDRVEQVEVSVDGGETWEEGEFLGPNLGPYGWRQFRYLWEAEPGEYFVVSRATDEQGRTQPAEIADPEEQLLTIQDDRFPYETGGYLNNAYEPHGVEVTVEE